jgi:hypothetical protein
VTDNYVQVSPNSTGLRIDTSELTVGSNVVERQRIVLANSSNSSAFATNFPAGFLRVTDEPSQIFYDPFDVSLDTTTRWSATITSGGGAAAAVSSGNMTMGSGTTASGYSILYSQPTFVPTIPSWLGVSFAIQIENPVTVNGYRFWGIGTAPGSPTTSAPLTDAIGFELYTDGKLYAVSYASGTRTVVQDMSSATGNSTQPTDANFHRYILYYRTDRSYWYIDQLDTVAGTSNFNSPNVQTLPVRFMAIAGSTPPTSSCVITCSGIAVWDTGKNNHTISDGTYQWRKAQVDSSSRLSIVQFDLTSSGNITALNANLNSGTATAGSTVALTNLNNSGSVAIQVTGTWTLTLTPQVSVDGANWIALSSTGLLNTNTGAYSATITGTNANGIWQADVGSFKQFRITCSAYTSGTAVVSLQASNGTGLVALDAPIPAGSNLIGSASIAQGGNTAVVKAASTAPVATDPALVVGVSPNSMVAKGTQASNALPVQDYKDSGRTPITLVANSVAGVASETMLTITQVKAGVSQTAATNYTVTAGKTFRITSFTVSGTTTAAAFNWIRGTMRYTTSGTVTTTSGTIITAQSMALAATANTPTIAVAIPISDGYEIPASSNYGISQIANSTSTTINVAVTGFEY